MDESEFTLPADFFTSSERLAKLYNTYHAGTNPALLGPDLNADALEMFSELLKSTVRTTGVNNVTYQFESLADTESAKQLQEERENLKLGLQSVEQSILFYNDKADELREQLQYVDEQLSQLRPGKFETGELKLESTPNVYVTRLEHAIVESMRKGGALSDKVIIVHHETWAEILKYMSSLSALMPEPFNVYKGIPVIRSLDAKKGEFLVK